MADRHLIVGGSGFIGRHVALLLALQGHLVTIASRTVPEFNFPGSVYDSITWEKADPARVDWHNLLKDAAVVHYYAWSSIPASANSDPQRDLNENVASLIGMLDAIRRRGGARIVFASSGGTVYGQPKAIPISEEHPTAPITAYGAGKASAEIYLGLYRSLYGIDCRIARLANPYGAGQNLSRPLGAATVFISRALQKQPIEIWGDGEVVRDFLHISDAAKCLVSLATKPQTDVHYIFNVGSGTGYSLNQLISEIEMSLDTRLQILRMPARRFDIPINVLAIDRAKDVLGWVPHVSMSDGIRRTISDLTHNLQLSTMF